MIKDRLNKIHSTGYWRVNIRPTHFEKERISSLKSCREIIEKSKVDLRGWDYPHLDIKETKNGDDWIESGCEEIQWGIVEYWRFYQSGQFIHHFACEEDYTVDQNNIPALSIINGSPSGLYLEIISCLWRVTEIFEFTARLASKGYLVPAAEISIKLINMENRQLFFQDRRRLLRSDYRCNIPEMTFKKDFAESDLMAHASEFALDATMYIFERFNWQEAPRSIFAEDQNKFFERRR